jgi:hypothetical protein
MSELIDNFDSYILNENNMTNYLKYKINKAPQEKINNKIFNQNKIKENTNKQAIFIPRENDTLFWCYYIIKNGDVKYETLNNKNIVITKQLKIELVNKIRENKQIVKTYKFDTITNIESNLANDNNIDIKTIMTLCSIEKINLIFIRKKTYYELLMNDNECIYIIRETENNNNYSKKYGYEIANNTILEETRDTLYRLDILNKPIKALSAYKVQDLIDIANKLAIEVINNENGKNKTKNELYESIIQYF